MKYLPTLTITNTKQLHSLPLQRGQWIKLDWCEHKSRFYGATAQHVTAFHYPVATSGFNSYCSFSKR